MNLENLEEDPLKHGAGAGSFLTQVLEILSDHPLLLSLTASFACLLKDGASKCSVIGPSVEKPNELFGQPNTCTLWLNLSAHL